jgi:hypothetical protein
MPIGRTVDGGEGEMPRISNALTRDLEELETQLTEEEAPQERTEGGMGFPFLVPILGEEVVVITEIPTGSEFLQIQEHLLNRPFYARHIHVKLNGRINTVCRCMIRREQVVTGETGPFAGLRSFTISNVVAQRFSLAARSRLYQEYLRRVTPGYRELPADFDFSIKADDESKMQKREVKEEMPKFAGWWSPARAISKYRSCLFLSQKTLPDPQSGRIMTQIFMVDYKGNPVEGMGLMQFYGDVGDKKGYVTLWSSITGECPFRTNSQRGYELSLERE